MCYCGIISCQDRAGLWGNLPGLGFWTCAAGRRDYCSERRDGIGHYEALDLWPLWQDFQPWLLSGLPAIDHES